MKKVWKFLKVVLTWMQSVANDWAFSETESAKSKREANNEIQEIKAFRNVGETFSYQGTECIVTEIVSIQMNSVTFTAKLVARYVNRGGVSKEVEFIHGHLKALIGENND